MFLDLRTDTDAVVRTNAIDGAFSCLENDEVNTPLLKPN